MVQSPQINSSLGRIAWWHKFDPNQSGLVVVDKEKKIMSEIFDLYVKKNTSLYEIAKLFDSKTIQNSSIYKRKCGTSTIRKFNGLQTQ